MYTGFPVSMMTDKGSIFTSADWHTHEIQHTSNLGMPELSLTIPQDLVNEFMDHSAEY
jgi:hypothetical protein